jgi:hypothetical protein
MPTPLAPALRVPFPLRLDVPTADALRAWAAADNRTAAALAREILVAAIWARRLPAIPLEAAVLAAAEVAAVEMGESVSEFVGRAVRQRLDALPGARDGA